MVLNLHCSICWLYTPLWNHTWYAYPPHMHPPHIPSWWWTTMIFLVHLFPPLPFSESVFPPQLAPPLSGFHPPLPLLLRSHYFQASTYHTLTQQLTHSASSDYQARVCFGCDDEGDDEVQVSIGWQQRGMSCPSYFSPKMWASGIIAPTTIDCICPPAD